MALNMVDIKVVVVLVIILSTAIEFCDGSVYKVGDSGGWTTIGNVDYKLWSATKNFRVGDVIRFEYNPQFHNVMRVTHAMYKACNTSLPLKSYTTGNDTITITTRGHHFFLCGVPGHCQAGQKVDINVPRTITSVNATAPSPPIFVSPSVPIAAKTPAPSASSASRNQRVGLVGLVAGFWLLSNLV